MRCFIQFVLLVQLQKLSLVTLDGKAADDTIMASFCNHCTLLKIYMKRTLQSVPHNTTYDLHRTLSVQRAPMESITATASLCHFPSFPPKL